MQVSSQQHQAPAPSTERISTIDTLRGLALFIVLLINAATEFRVSIFEQLLPATAGASTADDVAAGIVLALHSKGIILFSFLFGVGLAIQFDRLAGNERRLRLLLRRLAALLAFGLVHLFLIWNGDILTQYAVAGFVALPLLYMRRRPLILAAAGLLLWFVMSPLAPPLMPFPDHAWVTRHLAEAQHVYGNSGWMEILAFRMSEARAIAPLHPNILPRTLGLFLLGAWAWRIDVFRSGRLPDAMIAAAWMALFAGAAFLLVSQNGTAFGWPLGWQTAQILRSVSDLCLAFAYGTAIVAVAKTAWGKRAIGWAAPFGRMAFSNYIVQSIVLGLIFYGYGLGLFGRIGLWPCFAIVILIFAVQALVSKWWLDRFTFGPLEWLWRSLMYGRRQPMKRG